jgi:cell division protein FtsI (penicillin-binding protein 3)
MLGRTDSRRRLQLVVAGLIVVAASLLLRLGQWQIVERDTLAAEARKQTTLELEVATRRGSIYDRSGTVLLATTIDRYRLAAAPDQLSRVERIEIGEELARILDLDAEATTAFLAKLRDERPYVVLARDLDETTAEAIRRAMADGRVRQVTLEPEPTRVYPQPGGDPTTTLASHVLGFVNREGKGQYGIEQRYQATLAGEPKQIVAQRDASGRAVPDTQTIVDPGVAGVDLRLTIDASLQLALEQELFATLLADQAVSVSAVVIDPYTGEILAQASAPGYDANDYRAIATEDPGRFIDPVVSKVYEPGSVFKMLTAAAALERGTVGLKTKVNDSGILRLDNGKTRVEDADARNLGWITFEDVIAKSRNVGAARVALALGETTRDASVALHDTWSEYGFGRPTGIDVAGEVGGLVRDPTIVPWRQLDLANGSFGQGIAVTPIQLATAYSAMVNGGTLVQPHLVTAIGNEPTKPAPQATGLIDSPTSQKLVGLMRHVVESVPFYADKTLIPGFAVGGKTGTAQIWDSDANGGRGGWKVNKFNYSFVGYVGHDLPELVIAVRIEEARPSTIRSGFIELPVMSFELFRRLAKDAMSIVDLPEPPMPEPTPGKGDAWPVASPGASPTAVP